MKRSLILSFLLSVIALSSCGEKTPPVDPVGPIDDGAVTGVTVSPTSATVLVGATQTPTYNIEPEDALNKEVTWETSAPTVATVTDGVVSALAKGSAVITVKTVDGNHTATCTVTVEEIPVSGLSIKEVMSMDVGDAVKIPFEVLPADAGNKSVSFESGNPSIVSVADGVMTAVATGSTTITATTLSGGKTATATVTVYPAADYTWARSNIVWIPDETKPDGGYLTFAITRGDNNLIPADAQGVFFQWGSLVAISPSGMQYSFRKILFSPTSTKSYSWEEIPSLNEVTTPPFGNPDDTEDDFATYAGGYGFDAADGTGDICRYITSKGWVEGNWRMPRANEFTPLFTANRGGGNVAWDGNTWTDITGSPDEGNNAYGFYRPESGYFLGTGVTADDNRENPVNGYSFAAVGKRDYTTSGTTKGAGYLGNVWAGTSYNSYGTTAYTLEVYFYTVRRFNYNVKDGMPVRCIRAN